MHQASLLGDQRELEPPDPISNSEVKRFIADGSVRFPHVRVGHRQAFIQRKCSPLWWAFFLDQIWWWGIVATQSHVTKLQEQFWTTFRSPEGLSAGMHSINVGRRQAFNTKKPLSLVSGVFWY